MESFSTHGLPAARKVAFWNEVTSDTFAALEIEPRDVTRFDGRLLRAHLGPITLMEVRSSSVRVRHTQAHIARTPNPSYLLLAPLRGAFELRLPNAAAVAVRTGEFCLIDHARPYELVHGDGVRTLCVDIPRRSLEQRVREPEHGVGRVVPPAHALTRMLSAVLHGLGAELEHPDELSATFGASLLGFVTAAYEPYCSPPRARGRRVDAHALRAYIDSRVEDSALTPAEVATHFGISERYLRVVLGADGASFSAYVLCSRLAACATRLVDPRWRDRTITAIAFATGFSNATHFGHAFKAHYGLTPREYRQRGGLDPRRTRTHS